MLRSGHRKVWSSGKISDAFRPTTPKGVGVVLPSYPRSAANAFLTEMLNDSPLLVWGMQDPSGSSCSDLSGNARNGTYTGSPTLQATGPTTTNGNVPYAVTFNGSSQYVTIANDAAICGITTNITVEFWIKVVSRPGSFAELVCPGFDNYGFYLNSDGTLNVHRPGVGGLSGPVGGALTTGTWYHVMFSKSGTSSAVWYYNGSSNSSGTCNTPGTSSKDFEAAAGNETAAGQHPANVNLAYVAIYNTALSSTRASAHYNAA
jgi:Concanavalin A-like lectin/glucanases superfamily